MGGLKGMRDSGLLMNLEKINWYESQWENILWAVISLIEKD